MKTFNLDRFLRRTPVACSRQGLKMTLSEGKVVVFGRFMSLNVLL